MKPPPPALPLSVLVELHEVLRAPSRPTGRWVPATVMSPVACRSSVPEVGAGAGDEDGDAGGDVDARVVVDAPEERNVEVDRPSIERALARRAGGADAGRRGVKSAGQTLPQVPQLLPSVDRVAHPVGPAGLLPALQAGPLLHVVGGTHLPATQESAGAQGLPHRAAQFLGSSSASVQPVAQQVCAPGAQRGPPLQVALAATPFWHTLPVGQSLPRMTAAVGPGRW